MIGGWETLEFWVSVILYSRKKNSLDLEFTINDSNLDGIRKLLKILYLKKIPQYSLLGPFIKIYCNNSNTMVKLKLPMVLGLKIMYLSLT